MLFSLSSFISDNHQTELISFTHTLQSYLYDKAIEREVLK